MRRINSRIKAMIYLYQNDLTNDVSNFDYVSDVIKEFDFPDYDHSFYQEIIDGVIDNSSRIDRLIALCLKNYTLDRLSYIDRNLIRIGTFEMLYTKTPRSIIINEIVEISKEFSEIDNYNTSKFNNSLLDIIRKRIEEHESKS